MSSSSFDRLSEASLFFPTRSEWVKAGYYDPRAQESGGPPGHYWNYPTMSNEAPADVTVDGAGDATNPGPNVANSNRSADWNGQDGNVTTVGTAGAHGYYGTYDHAGNVQEWTEGLIPWCCGTPDARGGNWYLAQVYNNIYNLGNRPPETEDWFIGFRVGMVPEPDSVMLILIAAVAAKALSRRPG